MNNPTDAELSRAVAEKSGWERLYREKDGEYFWRRGSVEHNNESPPDYASSPGGWPLIGPEIEKRKIDCVYIRGKWIARIAGTTACGQDETLPRAACLAILDE